MDIVTAGKGALVAAKAVLAASKAMNEAEFKLKMADLMTALAEVQVEAAESIQRISELEAQLKQKEDMVYLHGLYYVMRGDCKEGPYCPTCWDKSRLQVRLGNERKRDLYCNVCEKSQTNESIPDITPPYIPRKNPYA